VYRANRSTPAFENAMALDIDNGRLDQHRAPISPPRTRVASTRARSVVELGFWGRQVALLGVAVMGPAR